MLQHGNMYNATYVRIHPTLEQNWGYFINSVVFLYFLNPFPIFDHFTMNIIFDNYLSNYVKIAIYWNFSPLFVLTSFMNASLFILLGDKHRQSQVGERTSSVLGHNGVDFFQTITISRFVFSYYLLAKQLILQIFFSLNCGRMKPNHILVKY